MRSKPFCEPEKQAFAAGSDTEYLVVLEDDVSLDLVRFWPGSPHCPECEPGSHITKYTSIWTCDVQDEHVDASYALLV